MSSETILTMEGIRALERELDVLKTVTRQEVANRIKEAKAFGDLSENAEYDEAKNEQAFVEGKIHQIEYTLRNAKVVDDDDLTTDTMAIGLTAKVLNIEEDEEYSYMIVGSAEAKPLDGRISNESPIGRALLGQKVGANVTVATPGGGMALRILEITK